MRQVPLRLYVLTAIALVLLMLPSAVSAMEAQIRIYIDGELIESEHKTELIEQVPYVTEQFVKQQLGVLTVWDSEHRTLALERGTYTAQLVLNESHAVAAGEAVRIDAPPIVLFGDIYLPATSLDKLLGVKVTWDIVNNALQFYLPQDNATSKPEGSTSSQQPSPEETNVQPSDNATSDDHIGYEDSNTSTGPEEDVTSASPNNSAAASIGSIETSGDQIIIQADGMLNADIFVLTEPDRLVIDIPNSKLGSQLNGLPPQLNGQVDSTHPHIQRIRYALFKNDPSTIRLVIDLNQPVQYSLVQQDDANKLVVDIRSKSFQVVLDAGHGGKDPGAITYSDKYEKDFTLPMTLKVYELLLNEPFIKPVLTRADDTFIELDERANIANNIDADIFLSIHGNTYIPSVHGTETFYYDIASKSLAETVHRHIVEESGFRDRNIRQEEYKVLRLAQMPAALIEVGYVSNKEQEALMYDEKFQDRIARAIVDAIKEYLQL